MFWRSACFNLTGCHFQKNNTFLLMIHICPNLHNYPIKMPSRTLYAQPPEVCLGLSVFFGCTLSPSPTIACLRKKTPKNPWSWSFVFLKSVEFGGGLDYVTDGFQRCSTDLGLGWNMLLSQTVQERDYTPLRILSVNTRWTVLQI